MSCLGVHFALTPDEVSQLRSFESDDERLAHLQEVIEEDYLSEENQLAVESDRAWDAMHRILSDGKLTWDGGNFPLNHVVLAGDLLYFGSDYIMSLKTPEQVKAIAEALSTVSFADFKSRYFSIDAEDYGFPLTDDDLSYTWEWFQGVREFIQLRPNISVMFYLPRINSCSRR